METLQSGVCVTNGRDGGYIYGPRVGATALERGGLVEMRGKVATTWPADHAMWRNCLSCLGFSFATS
jgi:hypothetical protein